jgi:hypothetical protein
MVPLESALVHIRKPWDKLLMEFWYTESDVRWVTFGAESIE